MESIHVTGVNVYICPNKVRAGFADSTRTVNEIGFIVVDVSTDAGVHGIGLTYYEVGNEAIRAFIKEVIEPQIIGMNPFETEVIWDKVFNVFRGVGRKGLAFCALSAVDIALWDIKGKVLGMPIYRLLGGNKSCVPVYASGGWTSFSTGQLVEESLARVSEGFKMIKIKVGVEGGYNPREDTRRVEAVRKAIGPDIRLALDANNIWKAGTAIKFAQTVSDYDIEFFEEPVLADDIPGLAHCRKMVDMPIATGEHEYTRFGIRRLLSEGAADIAQIDACRVGGYTEMLKMIPVTQAFNVALAPHCMELMHMHLVSAASNGLTLEALTLFRETIDNVFVDPPKPVNGAITIPDLPGLGLVLNMEWINRNGK